LINFVTKRKDSNDYYYYLIKLDVMASNLKSYFHHRWVADKDKKYNFFLRAKLKIQRGGSSFQLAHFIYDTF